MNDTEQNQETQLSVVGDAVGENLAILSQSAWTHAQKVALMCRAFIDATAVQISSKRYIPVEGWQSIAAAWGYTPSTEEPYKTPNGYRCKAQLKRDSDGAIISEAYGYVGDDEIWKDRAQYANEAMVQTRAISRVCRNKFAFVAVLMKIPNLATTPAEEVPRGWFVDAPRSKNHPKGEEVKKAEPKPNGDPKDSTYQGIIEKVWDYEAKKDDKDQRPWFNAEAQGRRLWTRKPEIGQMLIDANGLEVVLKLRSGSKPNVYQVMDVQPTPSGEPDDIPF